MIIAIICLACTTVAVSLLACVLWLKYKKNSLELDNIQREAGKNIDSAMIEAKAKTDFLASMSHEIRTPMNAINCATELLMKEELPESASGYLNILKNSSESLLDIVNDILDYSKIDAGKLKLSENEYNVKVLIEDVKSIIIRRLNGKNVAFTLDINPTLPCTLVGDESRIRQILINLLGNSVKYTTNGVISLKLTYERLSKDAIDLCIEVSDTGCGIPPSEKEKLFKRFDSGNVKSRKFNEGTGLGLSICSELAEMMGGGISVESELGKGSSFAVTVRQKIGENNAPLAEVGNNFSLNFLLWEDNAYYKQGIGAVLSSLGITYDSISNVTALSEFLGLRKNIEFLLVSSEHFNEARNIIEKLAPSINLVLLDDIDEAKRDSTYAGISLTKPIDIFSIKYLLDTSAGREKNEGSKNFSFTAARARILVVDDNRVNLKVAKALFETFKIKVVAVASGFEAVELINMGEKFDLIFMDHMMPGMDGITASKKIWELEGENRTPVIALTANAGGEIEKLFFDEGLSDFIPKPIVLRQLSFVLEKWLPKEKIDVSETETGGPESALEIKAPVFEPEYGLSKVWDDKNIFLETLHMYLDRCDGIIESLFNEGSLNKGVELLKHYKGLVDSVGGQSLKRTVLEAIAVGEMCEDLLYREKLDKIKEENIKLTAYISEYLKNEEPEDILTFLY